MKVPALGSLIQRAADANVDTFCLFEEVTHAVCEHLRKETGVQACALYDHERERVRSRLLSLSLEQRYLKLQSFVAYFEYLQELQVEGISIRNKQLSLRACLRKYGIQLPDEERVLATLDDSTLVELYNRDFCQFYRSFDFLTVTNYSLMALESFEWHELFDRAASVTQELGAVVQAIWEGKVRYPVFKPIESHTVKELWSHQPLSTQIDVLMYSPVYSESGDFQGGIHCFKVRSSQPLKFQVVGSV
jgi:hypothetical protein